MGLSNDLLSQFAKITNDKTNSKKESTTYGTAKVVGGATYVQIDGSDLLTPYSSTADVKDGDRVQITIKNHNATITGNLSSPSARTDDVKEIDNKVTSHGNTITSINNSVKEIDNNITSINNNITEIGNTIDSQGNQITQINNVVTSQGNTINSLNNTVDTQGNTITEIGDTVNSQGNTIKSISNTIDAQGNQITAINNTIESQGNIITEIGNTVNSQGNTINSIGNTVDAQGNQITAINNDIEIYNSSFQIANGIVTGIKGVDTEWIKTEDLEADHAAIASLDNKYANIDFTNIGKAAMEYFYANSGLIKDVVVGDQKITGHLIGVTISGDLIEGNTIVAEKLVIKGDDGLYYKLNTDGIKTEAEQTDYNSINGTIIKAKSITATKIAVEDLVAFGATIGGFVITDNSIHSGVKESVDNTTKGIYLDNQGQIAFGDGTNFVKYYKDAEGNYRLAISAESVDIGTTSKTDVGTAINDIQEKANSAIISSIEQFYKSDSPTSLSGGSWSIVEPVWEDGKYLWRRTKNTYGDGHSDYTPSENGVCITGNTGPRGLQGLQGAKGDQGIPGEAGKTGPQGPQGVKGDPGEAGKNGKTSYFHIKYSSDPNPTTASQMTETPSTYIGTYVDYTSTDSSDPTKYTWSRFQGAQGAKGDRGIPGTNGTNGKTSYLHIAYANSADGKTGFDVSTSTNKLYIGQYTDFTSEDSTDPTKYSWTKIKGETGAQGPKGDTGATGKGISKITNYYLATASSTGVTTSTSGWTEAIQNVSSSKKYLWNYEKITYTDNTTASTSPCIIGAYGDTGAQGPKGDTGATGATGSTGATGNGISSISEYYAVSTSNSTAPTSWSTTVPTLTPTNKYMWNYETITYTNGSKKDTSKRVIGVYGDKGATGATGATGSQGPKGDAGAEGKGIASVIPEYYLSSSKTTQAGGSWSTTPPTWASGKYLWVRQIVTYTDSSVSRTQPYCDTSWEAVNEVQIGGMNLLLNSRDLTKWSKENGVSVTKDSDGWFKVVEPSHTAQRWGIYFDFAKHEQNTDYTLSVDVKCGNTKIGVGYGLNSFGTYYKEIDSGSKRIKMTFNTGSNTNYIRVYLFIHKASANQYGYFKLPKLEKGNKATDWSPAPEDVETSINTAQSAANTAQSTADTAKKNAATAQSTADTAKKNAATAQSTADTAQSTADTAKKNAATAQSTADTAKKNAATAQSTADTAKKEAANAAKTATNYLHYDSNGLTVSGETFATGGDPSGKNIRINSNGVNIRNGGTVLASYGESTTIGSTSGRHILIDSDSVDIKNGNTILSQFMDSTIYLGKNSSTSTVDFCNGNGYILGRDDSTYGKGLWIHGGNRMYIVSKKELFITASVGGSNNDPRIRMAYSDSNSTLDIMSPRISIVGDTTISGTVKETLTACGKYASPESYYNNGALLIRESNLNANTSGDFGYAPRIGFDWYGFTGGSFSLNYDGTFYLRKQDGNTRATLDANINGNLSGSSSTSDSLWMPRVGGDVNWLPDTRERTVMREYSSDTANLPNANWYHILANRSFDISYGSQLAIGMTTNDLYYRCYSVGSFSAWHRAGVNVIKTTPGTDVTIPEYYAKFRIDYFKISTSTNVRCISASYYWNVSSILSVPTGTNFLSDGGPDFAFLLMKQNGRVIRPNGNFSYCLITFYN